MALEREMSWEETVHNIQSSSTSFQWTDEQLKSLDENQEYHAKMLETIAIVRKQGPIKKVPKQPKRKLSDLFKEIEGTKKPKTQMTSSELNEYLKKHLVDIQLVSNRSFFYKYGTDHEQDKYDRTFKKRLSVHREAKCRDIYVFSSIWQAFNYGIFILSRGEKRRENTG